MELRIRHHRAEEEGAESRLLLPEAVEEQIPFHRAEEEEQTRFLQPAEVGIGCCSEEEEVGVEIPSLKCVIGLLVALYTEGGLTTRCDKVKCNTVR